jgi:hypothetical protein
MPGDLRYSNGRDSDDWLTGGDLDWGDSPERPPLSGGTRTTAGRPPKGELEPLWPDLPPEHEHPDEATIRRRRLIGLIALVGVVGAVILLAVVVFGGSDGGTTETPTTTAEQPVTTPTTTTPTPTTPQTPTTPTTPTTELTLPDGESMELDSTGAEVEALQEALTTLGYDPGPVDGDFGASTQNAVGEFQRDQGLPDDGVVGPATLEALNDALAERPSTGTA